MNEQVSRARIFDLCCYKALMKMIFGVDELDKGDIPA